MTIRDILEKIDVVSSYISPKGERHRILSLCHDSRRATPQSLFFCKSGALTDGHIFAQHAYKNGARLFIAERELDLPKDASVIIVPNAHNALSDLSVWFYGEPAKSLKLIGITGTKGKTTVALSVYSIAEAAGIKIGYIGTNGIYYNGQRLETANTTPDVLEMQKTLRQMVDAGIDTVVIEVSSQALWQDRTYGLTFDTVAFTNLYEDHIGGVEHPTFEHYKKSKKLLFSKYKAKNIVVNSDSKYTKYMLDGVECDNIITTSAKGKKTCTLYAKNTTKTSNGIIPGISFICHGNICADGLNVFMRTPGLHNVENGLITLGICSLLGISADLAAQAFATVSVPGRFEVVTLKSRPNSLFVIDYAHNGASLTAVLKTLREYEPNRIICLFGSVGGRTFGRRRELGVAARDGADVLIITSDNPNNESPMNVINEIKEAVGKCDKEIYLISDREKAIEKAIELASDGDFVLLAGKGHETYQLVMGERVPFCEKEILEHFDRLHLIDGDIQSQTHKEPATIV